LLFNVGFRFGCKASGQPTGLVKRRGDEADSAVADSSALPVCASTKATRLPGCRTFPPIDIGVLDVVVTS
jgi:hypothetical protein